MTLAERPHPTLFQNKGSMPTTRLTGPTRLRAVAAGCEGRPRAQDPSWHAASTLPTPTQRCAGGFGPAALATPFGMAAPFPSTARLRYAVPWLSPCVKAVEGAMRTMRTMSSRGPRCTRRTLLTRSTRRTHEPAHTHHRLTIRAHADRGRRGGGPSIHGVHHAHLGPHVVHDPHDRKRVLHGHGGGLQLARRHACHHLLRLVLQAVSHCVCVCVCVVGWGVARGG